MLSISMPKTVGDVTGAGTVSVRSMEDADVVDIGDADSASTVTAYVVILLVGFVRVVVVDFFEFSIFVVVGLFDPRESRKRPRRGGIGRGRRHRRR